MDEFVKRSNEIKEKREANVKWISGLDREKIYSLLSLVNENTWNWISKLDLEPSIKSDLIIIFQNHKYTERTIIDGLLLKAEKNTESK